jgi:YidC/Oxa1 family membrane protein insertase
MQENRNILISITLSILVLFIWSVFYEQPRMEEYQKDQIAKNAKEAKFKKAENNIKDQKIVTIKNKNQIFIDRNEVISDSNQQRINIKSDKLKGSISLKGARFDDLELLQYQETIDENSDNVKLLSPLKTFNHYFIDFGFLSSNSNLELPNSKSIWQADYDLLSNEKPVILSWKNKDNILFQIKISLDNNYMFEIKKSIQNNSQNNITIASFGRINRHLKADSMNNFILHEGPIAVANKLLTELPYNDLKDDGDYEFQADSGWIGITDKYWLTSMIPDNNLSFNGSFSYQKSGKKEIYDSQFITDEFEIAANETININHRLFAGAKIVSLLDSYGQEFAIDSFDKAVDFGWYYFLTKPFFFILSIFSDLLKNYGLAILAMTLLVKLAMFPLAHKSFTAIGRMKKFQPRIMEIREQNKNDKVEMNRQIMELYKREGVNPAAGCLPMLIQIPVFFSLYKVLFVTIDMRHAPFYGWIKDLSAGDPTSIFNLFGLLPFAIESSFLQIGIWPILMGLTMVLQQKLSPAPADPMQAKMMKFLPYILILVFAAFPAGLLIYWTFSNILSIAQQYYITRKLS